MIRGNKECNMQNERFSVYRIWVYNEDGSTKYSEPLWLIAAGKKAQKLSLEAVFYAYDLRFNIEHWFKFAKEHLLLDKFQSPEICNHEQWLLFPMIATHMLYHAKDLSELVIRPWESLKQAHGTPAKTKRSMSKILTECGTPASEPKTRGVSSERIAGNNSIREDKPITFKTIKVPQAGEEIIIKIHIDDTGAASDVKLKGKILSKATQEAKNTLIEDVKKLLPQAA